MENEKVHKKRLLTRRKLQKYAEKISSMEVSIFSGHHIGDISSLLNNSFGRRQSETDRKSMEGESPSK